MGTEGNRVICANIFFKLMNIPLPTDQILPINYNGGT